MSRGGGNLPHRLSDEHSQRDIISVFKYYFFFKFSGMGSRQFCQGRGQGREVEAEARQGSNVLTEARQGRGRELEAKERQSEIDVVCVILILSCTMHMY